MTQKIQNIDIKAREWFDKVNGNSYFSARIYINDQEVGILPFQYGYDDHYIDMATAYLHENGFIDSPRHSNGSRGSLWRYCKDNNIRLTTTKQERCLKRELIKREVVK